MNLARYARYMILLLMCEILSLMVSWSTMAQTQDPFLSPEPQNRMAVPNVVKKNPAHVAAKPQPPSVAAPDIAIAPPASRTNGRPPAVAPPSMPDATVPKIPDDDVGFSCPRAGTTIQISGVPVPFTRTYKATASGDPAICRSSTSLGTSQILLYNIYNVSSLREQDEVRAGMSELFSRSKDKVSFQFRSNGGYPFYTFADTWTRLGRDAVMIGNRNVRAIVFEQEREGQYQNYFHGKWKLWYEPATGLFVRSEFTLIRGAADLNGNFEATLVSSGR